VYSCLSFAEEKGKSIQTPSLIFRDGLPSVLRVVLNKTSIQIGTVRETRDAKRKVELHSLLRLRNAAEIFHG
jgi:hypothetical protein